ncbi:MAG: hypothetical protein ABL898_05950 [Hyphomicrobiaceae bacterium]
MQKLLEAAFSQWRNAPADQKSTALLSGSAVVWAERWLLTHPDEVSYTLKNFILRSLAHQSQMHSTQWIEQRQELQRKDRSYNRILIVMALLALSVLAPKALRDSGLLEVTATPGASQREPSSDVAQMPAATNGDFGSLKPALRGRTAPSDAGPSNDQATVVPSDAAGDGQSIEEVPAVSADQLAKLAKAAALKGDRRTGHLLALEYWYAAIAAQGTQPELTPVMWGQREVTVERKKSLPMTTALISALSSRTVLQHAQNDPMAHHRGVIACRGSANIAAVTEGRRLKVWDTRTGHTQYVSEGRVGSFSSTALDRDCRKWASASDDYDVFITELTQGSTPVRLGRHDADIVAFDFDGAGRVLATVSQDSVVKVWDTQSRRQLGEFRATDEHFLGVAMSVDGARVLTWAEGSTAQIWDVKSGQRLSELRGHSSRIDRAHFTTDERHILTVSSDGSALLWQAQTFDIVAKFVVPGGSVVRADLSADASTVALVTDDGGVEIWAGGKKAAAKVLALEEQVIVVSAFNAAATLVATATQAGQISIWDVKTGRQLIDVALSGPSVALLAFSNDATTLRATTFDGAVTEWPVLVSANVAQQIARRFADGCLTSEERLGLKLDGKLPDWCEMFATRP